MFCVASGIHAVLNIYLTMVFAKKCEKNCIIWAGGFRDISLILYNLWSVTLSRELE